jgi:hypothetical protein
MLMDAVQFGDRATSVHSAFSTHACAAAVAQAGDELEVQINARI